MAGLCGAGELAQCFSMAAASVSDAPPGQKYLAQGLDMLKRARQQGYKNLVVLETDPDLRLLREQPEFKRLIMATDEIAPDI